MEEKMVGFRGVQTTNLLGTPIGQQKTIGISLVLCRLSY